MIENAERKVTTEISLLDAIIVLKKAWDTVSKLLQSRGLDKPQAYHFCESSSELASEINQFGLEMPVISFYFVHADDDVITYEILSDETIVQNATIEDDREDAEEKEASTPFGNS